MPILSDNILFAHLNLFKKEKSFSFPIPPFPPSTIQSATSNKFCKVNNTDRVVCLCTAINKIRFTFFPQARSKQHASNT